MKKPKFTYIYCDEDCFWFLDVNDLTKNHCKKFNVVNFERCSFFEREKECIKKYGMEDK